MNPVAETLLFPYRKGMLPKPDAESRLLFLNAADQISDDWQNRVFVQPRYDKALPLIQAGYQVLPSAPAEEFDTAWLLAGKDMEETQYLLAVAVDRVKDGGTIVAAAANDAGGRRLEGLFEKLGLGPQAESKNKSRVVFAMKEPGMPEMEPWLKQGEDQRILGRDILSRPGLHGWDKTDEGSALLARVIPPLEGHVADFGCGWGYLSLQAAAASKHIARLTLIDVDARAVRLAERNVHAQNPALPLSSLWADLGNAAKPFGPYDAILLNPPFHDGARTVPDLGQAIIATAAKSLKKNGVLYLVANTHLPYEKPLRDLFPRIEPLREENGFKTFACRLN